MRRADEIRFQFAAARLAPRPLEGDGVDRRREEALTLSGWRRANETQRPFAAVGEFHFAFP